MVLIIADEPAAREVYGELFAMRGYDVVLAADAREGLRVARDRRIGVVVLAMATGAMRLRRKLTTMRPLVRVHMTGLMPLPFDVMTPVASQQLH
jgi:DNA-binding response OmpR family regulator